jgi:hypothetical protein
MCPRVTCPDGHLFRRVEICLPYVRWCEGCTPSFDGGAIHSIACLAFLSSNLLALGKTYSFVIFGLCFGLSELQMCMALSVGYFSVSIFHSIVFNLSATTFNVFSISFSDGNSPKTNSLKLVS